MNRSAGDVFRGVVALVALSLVALAALPALLPATVDLPPVRALVETFGEDAESVALLAGFVLALLFALLSLFSGGSGDDPFDELRERPPEAVTADAATRAGGEFDARFSAATAEGGQRLSSLRADLRSLATRAHASAASLDHETARERVWAGEWTENRTAGAFLATSDDVTPSLVSRVRLWLDPPAERARRVRETVAEVERALDGEGEP